MATGKVTAVCGCFHAEEIVIFSESLLEFIRKCEFLFKKKIKIVQIGPLCVDYISVVV